MKNRHQTKSDVQVRVQTRNRADSLASLTVPVVQNLPAIIEIQKPKIELWALLSKPVRVAVVAIATIFFSVFPDGEAVIHITQDGERVEVTISPKTTAPLKNYKPSGDWISLLSDTQVITVPVSAAVILPR